MTEVASLASCRVLVTRAADRAQTLITALELRGARVIAIPVIATETLGASSVVRTACLSATDVVFTSAAAVTHSGELRDVLTSGQRVWAVGPATGEALALFGVDAQPLAETYSASALTTWLTTTADLPYRHFVLPQAEGASPELASGLEASGATVTAIPVYRTVTVRDAGVAIDAALQQGIDVATFMSGSAVSATVELLGGSTPLAGIVIACVGVSTAAVAADCGLRTDVVADVHTVDGLVDALDRHFRQLGFTA